MTADRQILDTAQADACILCNSIAMGRIRSVSGEDVMTEAEFAAWWQEHQGGRFLDVLRRHVARQLQVQNFRQLALICGDQVLAVPSQWVDAEMVTVVRPYADDDGLELLQAARDGDAAKVATWLHVGSSQPLTAFSDEDSWFRTKQACAGMKTNSGEPLRKTL